MAKHKPTPETQAYLYALAAVLLWSTVGSAFKITLRYVDVFYLLMIAALVSWLVIGCFLIIQKKIHLVLKTTKKELIYSLGLGLLNPCIYYMVLFTAYDLLPVQQAQPINYIWPLVLSLLSVPLLKQAISIRSIIALLISLFGVVIISFQGDFSTFNHVNGTGVFLALLSTLIWSLYWIFNVKDARDPVIKLFLNFGFGFLGSFMCVVLFSGPQVPDYRGILGGIYVGCFEMGFTFFLWLKALSLSTNNAKISNLIYISPFLSLVFIQFIVGEHIVTATLVGLLFILAGILLQQVSLKRIAFRKKK